MVFVRQETDKKNGHVTQAKRLDIPEAHGTIAPTTFLKTARVEIGTEQRLRKTSVRHSKVIDAALDTTVKRGRCTRLLLDGVTDVMEQAR